MVNLIKTKNAEIQTLITLIKKVIPQYSTKQDALKPDVELVPDSDVEPLPDSNTVPDWNTVQDSNSVLDSNYCSHNDKAIQACKPVPAPRKRKTCSTVMENNVSKDIIVVSDSIPKKT